MSVGIFSREVEGESVMRWGMEACGVCSGVVAETLRAETGWLAVLTGDAKSSEFGKLVCGETCREVEPVSSTTVEALPGCLELLGVVVVMFARR